MGSGAFGSTINFESAFEGETAMPTRSKSLTTTERELAEGELMPPLHPGEMLREEFMKPLGLSANALAMALRVPVTRITEIVRERRGITADTALRLGRYFNLPPEFWMGLQMDYDLESAASDLKDTLEMEIRPRPVAQDSGKKDSRAIA